MTVTLILWMSWRLSLISWRVAGSSCDLNVSSFISCVVKNNYKLYWITTLSKPSHPSIHYLHFWTLVQLSLHISSNYERVRKSRVVQHPKGTVFEHSTPRHKSWPTFLHPSWVLRAVSYLQKKENVLWRTSSIHHQTIMQLNIHSPPQQRLSLPGLWKKRWSQIPVGDSKSGYKRSSQGQRILSSSPDTMLFHK